jgi:transposase-like protein
VRYTPEFKQQMVGLLRGRTPGSLAKEFGPTLWSIALWVKQDARGAGKGDGGLITGGARGAQAAAPREPVAEARARDSLKSHGLLRNGERRDLEARFGFVKVNQATHSVGKMCRFLGISKSGFYA